MLIDRVFNFFAASDSDLNSDQRAAMQVLRSSENVFLTGGAGTGKSFTLKAFLNKRRFRDVPCLASTGAAAFILGGRTFHSFFGLGILKGGVSETVKRAVNDSYLARRLCAAKTVVIDEISMIHPRALAAAEEIARRVRGRDLPWGGLRIIAVGDFFQLPPVDQFSDDIPWAFESEVWRLTGFHLVELKQVMRTNDEAFISVLNKVRRGFIDSEVRDSLNSKLAPIDENFRGTTLFGTKWQTNAFNLRKLDQLSTPIHSFPTKYETAQLSFDHLTKVSPVSPTLFIREGAFVLIQKNDPDGAFVNGSQGYVRKISQTRLEIELLNGNRVAVEPEEFSLLNGDGLVIATATNFPVSLGWATTIHKSQGASIERLQVDLDGLWEHGQGYVALSRSKNPNELRISSWRESSFRVDTRVLDFYRSFNKTRNH